MDGQKLTTTASESCPTSPSSASTQSPSSSLPSAAPESVPKHSDPVTSPTRDCRAGSGSDTSSVSDHSEARVDQSASPCQPKHDCCRGRYADHGRVDDDELRKLSRMLGLKNLKCIPNEGGRNVLIGFDWPCSGDCILRIWDIYWNITLILL